MFQKFRRNSRQLFDSGGGGRRTSLATVRSASESSPAPVKKEPALRNLTFFDLPAELRNIVYQEVASQTALQLRSPGRKPGKQPPPPPALLQASRQARHEYLPLLLEFSRITVVVKEFDFRNLTRIVGSLYATELKSLRANERLRVAFLGVKCTKESLVSLRRWLVSRSEGLDRLPFHYCVQWPETASGTAVEKTERRWGMQDGLARVESLVQPSTPVRLINRYIQRRSILNQNLEALAQLHLNIEEGLRFELGPVIQAFENEVQRIQLQGGSVVAGLTGVQERWQAAPGIQTGVRMWSYF